MIKIQRTAINRVRPADVVFRLKTNYLAGNEG